MLCSGIKRGNWPRDEDVRYLSRGMQQKVALATEVAFYAAREALRNAAKHAHPIDPEDSLRLIITAGWKNGLEIIIEDNGVGPIEPTAGSSGQGLILHSTMMAVVGGSLALESAPGLPTRVILRLPVEIAV